MSAISGKEVIQFFKTADLELAELVLEFGTTAVEQRVEARAKISANLKKARAARKPAGSTDTQAAVAEAPTVAAEPVRRGPGRPHAVHAQTEQEAEVQA